MRAAYLKYLMCPKCKEDLELGEVQEQEGNSIKTGVLTCKSCSEEYEIKGFIPRFVAVENYASGFGLEWSRHARTQYDSYSGESVSENRFFGETNWPRNLVGQSILEVGSGSGRFTEQAASTGAFVVSVDYSYAVDANYASNGSKNNVLIVQGDIYSLPVKQNIFDKAFCIGVLQHTPYPKEAFLQLPLFLKLGGELVIDVYEKFRWPKQLLVTKYWVRPLTKKLKPETLYSLVRKYVKFMWPLAKWINKLPKGRQLNRLLLIADYGGAFNLSDEMLKEWAILDTFDMLSPVYDYPQTIEQVREWFDESGLRMVNVRRGYLGPLGSGIR